MSVMPDYPTGSRRMNSTMVEGTYVTRVGNAKAEATKPRGLPFWGAGGVAEVAGMVGADFEM